MVNKILKFMNPDDAQHKTLLCMPGFDTVFKFKTYVMLFIWANVFMSPVWALFIYQIIIGTV